MFDLLTQRAQPTAEYINRLERFCLSYAQSLRNRAECVPYSLAERMRVKSDRVLDLLRGWRLR